MKAVNYPTVAQGFISTINATRTKLIEIFNQAIYDGLPADTPFKEILAENGFKHFISKSIDKEYVSYFTQIYNMVLSQINHAAESAINPLRQCDSEAYWDKHMLPYDFMNQFKKSGALASFFEYPENPGVLDPYKPIIWKNHGLIVSIADKFNETLEMQDAQERVKHDEKKLIQEKIQHNVEKILAQQEELAQKEVEDEVNERYETSSQQSGGSSSPSKKSESRTDSDEVRLNPFNQGQNPNLSDRTGSFGRNSDVMQEEQPQPAPNSEMGRMMARMREMEELLAAKDAKIDELEKNSEKLVSKEKVEAIVAENERIIEEKTSQIIQQAEAMQKMAEDNSAKDSIIREQARDKEFLDFKYSTSQDTVKRQDKALADKDKVIESKDKMLESQDKMLESQNKVIDHLNDDKKHLHQEVEEWKISHEIKEKQLIELTEMLKYNDKDPSDKLSFVQEFLNNSLIKGLQTVSSHEYHSELSGESSYVKLEELSDH